MSELGNSVTKSAKFIAKIGEQVESMIQLITTNLSDSFKNIEKYYYPSEDWKYRTRYDQYEWVLSDYSCCIGLKLKEKKKSNPKSDPIGYLIIQISLWQDGAEFVGNEEPLIHISWWDDPIEIDKDNNYFGSLFGDDEDFVIESSVLINWNPEAKTIQEQRWSYSLRLTSINDLNDIRNKIVNPVIDLFNKGIEKVVLSISKIDGIVAYKRSSDQPKRSLQVISSVESVGSPHF